MLAADGGRGCGTGLVFITQANILAVLRVLATRQCGRPINQCEAVWEAEMAINPKTLNPNPETLNSRP